MNNSQFSKCDVCGLDEKFVLILGSGNEVRVCKNKCNVVGVEKKDHKDAVFRESGPAVTGYWG